MKTVYLNASYFPAVELLSAVGTAVILIYGGYQALDLTGDARAEQIGVVVAFVGYLATFFDPIQQLSNLYTTYQQGMAALDKIFDLLDTEPDLVDEPDAIDPRPLRGEIELDGVWFSYGRDNAAGVKRSSEQAAASRRFAAMAARPTTEATGRCATSRSTSPPARRWRWWARPARARAPSPSWCRASTTRSAAACWSTGTTCASSRRSACAASSGSCRRRGSCSAAPSARTSHSGVPTPRDEEVEAAADAIGAGEFIRRMPDGFETEVGERGVALSAGQRQLIAFARALLAEPRILILDEATSNVDVRTERAIESGLERLLEGRTAIVIAHRLSTIRGRRPDRRARERRRSPRSAATTS